LGIPWNASWVEPDQIPTKTTLFNNTWSVETTSENYYAEIERDFAEFRPAQYIRLPFCVKPNLQKARVYITAHGLYKFEVNGTSPDDREFAPENSSYFRILHYQTYDVTSLLRDGDNVFGVILGDGWWAGRLGFMGDSGQYGSKIGLLFEAVLLYQDGTQDIVTGDSGMSSTGPIVFCDIFVGEKYDATQEIDGWSNPEFDDSEWKLVNRVEYSMDNLVGQYGEPVRPIKVLKPQSIIFTHAGVIVLDIGQVMAGQIEFYVDAPDNVAW
jgi:alpha-L-rhamnosidase